MTAKPGNSLAMLPTTSDADNWTPDQAALMQAAGAYRMEGNQPVLAPRPTVAAFLRQCERSGLDPIARQIYLIYRAGRWGIQGAIDGFRVVARRYPDYAGQDTEWCGPDGVWQDVWPDFKDDNGKIIPPMAARVKVYMKGQERPTTGVAKWSEFAIVGRGGENWEKMPSHMLAKVAEALALRKAFPQDLSGIYTGDEMGNEEAASATAVERDWVAEVKALTERWQVGELYEEMRAAGEWTKARDAEFRSHATTLPADTAVKPAEAEEPEAVEGEVEDE